MHEYESLLFSDTVTFAAALGERNLAPRFTAIRNAFDTPEEINDDPNTAPSKRIATHYPQYDKVIDGTLAAQKIGIESMRRECPHFRAWVERLALLPAG